MRKNTAGILINFVAGLALVHNLPGWKDVEFGDETTYLGSGLHFSIPFLGGVQWGPLYAAWYAFLNKFAPEALDLYYLNWALLSIFAGAFVFLYFRSSKVTFWVSLWFSVLFLFSPQNLPLNPKISMFPFCLILLTLSLIFFFRTSFTLFQKFVLSSLTGLLCAYVRPEYYISFMVGGAIALVLFLWKRDFKSLKSWSFLLVFGLFIFLLSTLFGNPMGNGRDDRGAIAFQQHFIVNYCAWKGIPEPSTIRNQLNLFHSVMGNKVYSLGDALIAQPGWTLRHIGFNTLNTLKGGFACIVDIFYRTLLKGWYSPFRLVPIAAVIIVFLLIVDYSTTWRRLKQALMAGRWDFILVLTLIFPSLVASIFVFPRTHYLVFLLILLFWVLANLVTCLSFRGLNLPEVKISNFLSTTGAITLSLFVLIRYADHREVKPTPVADNIRYITQLKPLEGLNILERNWYRVFLPYSTRWIHVEDYTGASFSQFLEKNDVNFILMSADMQAYFARDPGFNQFITQYPREGFVRFPTNSQGDYLLVKTGVFE